MPGVQLQIFEFNRKRAVILVDPAHLRSPKYDALFVAPPARDNEGEEEALEA
jgi:hypothetical protein